MTVYNRFDPKDRWVQLQAISGRRLQSAELNEIQSLSIYRDKRMGDVIFGSGHIIEGGQLYVSADHTVIITPASVYLDGFIHDVAEKELTITGVGEEVIGLKVTFETVTYKEKPVLLDPSIGYSNYGSPGMDRLVANPTWVLNDPAAIPMYRLVNGELVTAKLPPELEGFTPVLARRTHDTSGSFLVSGMDGFVEPKNETDVTLVVEAGKAYVLGYEINKLVPTRISIPKAQGTRTVINEQTVFSSATRYTLKSKPVKQINQITATVQKTDEITRGNTANGMDRLPRTPVIDIDSIIAGTTTYTKDVDYRLNGDEVDWGMSGGVEPPPNTKYKVTYRFVKTMEPDKDYRQEGNEVVWISGGDVPVGGTAFHTTYEYYLPRKDVFYLTAEGLIKIIHGQSDLNPPLPSVPPDVLELGELYLPANSSMVRVTNYKPKRLTMLELRSLLDRLERAEYNQAITDLDRSAQLADPSSVKKGIFTDNFTNFERSDVNHSQFDAMLDPVNKVLQLPVQDEFYPLVPDLAKKQSVHIHERLATLAYTEEILIQQSYATETLNVNPYQVFGVQASIRLTPSQDSWIESYTVTRTIWGWWSAWWGGTRTETRIILDENLPFIRQRVVNILGEGFEPGSDNLQATFDGLPVALNPVTSSGTLAGRTAGTVKADEKGRFSATFTIPPNIRTGTREVRVFNYN